MPWVRLARAVQSKESATRTEPWREANSGESGGKSLTYIAAGYRIHGL